MLEKSITSIAHNSGQSVFQTFSDFLDYTIGYFGVGKNAVKKTGNTPNNKTKCSMTLYVPLLRTTTSRI